METLSNLLKKSNLGGGGHPTVDVIKARITAFWSKKKKKTPEELGGAYGVATAWVLYEWAGLNYKEVGDYLKKDWRTIKTWVGIANLTNHSNSNVYDWIVRLLQFILWYDKYVK